MIFQAQFFFLVGGGGGGEGVGGELTITCSLGIKYFILKNLNTQGSLFINRIFS